VRSILCLIFSSGMLFGQPHPFRDACISSQKPAPNPTAAERATKLTVDALIQAARNLAGVPIGPPCDWYEHVLTKMHGLEISSLGITDLAPLASLSQLEQLTMTNNAISDLRPLEGLGNLKSVDISGNRVADLQALANLRNLRELRAMSNSISSVAPLERLEHLQIVWLSNNRIASVSALGKFSGLLYLQNNTIQDITVLSSVSQLDINGNKVDDLRNYKPAGLGVLNISNNPVATNYPNLDGFFGRMGPALRFRSTWTDPLFIPPVEPNTAAYINRSKTVLACNILGGFSSSEVDRRFWPACEQSVGLTGVRHLK
jgi:hypothetical protein